MITNVDYKSLKEELNKNQKLIVFFTVDWCGECKMMDLLIEEISSETKEIKFLKIDMDENWLWKDEKNDYFNLLIAPTIIIFENNKELRRIDSFRNKEEINEFLKNI